ncbi:MAG: ATP-binding cassette domain-containing protein [Nitrospirae bacterium]|nr:ATP-binding cassette domain-containing protein [Nitrospirota bacterium]
MGLSVELKKKVGPFDLDVAWEMADELAVLFGYSGAGKSITLQMIAGLMQPDAGVVRCGEKVLFDSFNKINLPPQKRSFGYVFQNLALFPHMTVDENIRYGATGISSDECRKRLAEIIGAFRLEEVIGRLPSKLSGGQQQRVAFARALIRKPDVLLLDEPFSALDNPLRLEMRQFLKDVRNTFNIPVVLVTHDIIEAYTMADNIIVYSNGRVVQTGHPSEVFNHPANKEVEALVDTKKLMTLP